MNFWLIVQRFVPSSFVSLPYPDIWNVRLHQLALRAVLLELNTLSSMSYSTILWKNIERWVLLMVLYGFTRVNRRYRCCDMKSKRRSRVV